MNVIDIDPKFKKFLGKGFDINKPMEKALIKWSLIIQNSGKENAPFATGQLRQSITTNLSWIKNLNVVIGSPLPYAQRRNFENKKNPHTKNYLVSRAYDDNVTKLDKIINDALQDYFW